VSLRWRVFLSVALLVAATVLGAWLVAGGAVLRPLVGELSLERVDTAVYAARQIREAEDPRDRARELAQELGIRMRLLDERPERAMAHHGRTIEREGLSVTYMPGRRAPVLVSLGEDGGGPYLAVFFPVDLERPQRRVLGGLVLLLGGAVVVAVGASRWMLRPLELTSDAMERVAGGDLAHRVDATGNDAAGRMGSTFNRMADRVQAMVVGQRELMAAVSHELRTPLSRMRLHAELLREQGAGARHLEALDADITEVDGLVAELLESARLHQGLLALHREELRLAELVDGAVAAADLGPRPVTVEVPDDLVLTADPSRLGRGLANLLSNVGRYTPEDAAVEVRATPVGDHVDLVVADRGPGVSPEALDRLFEPFYRAEASRSRRTGGLGLGLMLVRQVVEAHGGTVVARNREGGGLEICCRLPS